MSVSDIRGPYSIEYDSDKEEGAWAWSGNVRFCDDIIADLDCFESQTELVAAAEQRILEHIVGLRVDLDAVEASCKKNS